MENDRPNVTRDDIDGLRTSTEHLATSVEGLAARQKVTDDEIAKKADRRTVAALAELSHKARRNLKLALAALTLVVVALALVVVTNHQRADQDARDRADRITAFCHSLDQIAVMVKAGSTGSIQAIFDFSGPTTDPAKVQAFVDDFNSHGGMAVDAALHQVKATNGFTDDCHISGGN